MTAPVLLLLLLLVALRVLACLPGRVTGWRGKDLRPRPSARVMVVLGSGGHTMEMLQMLRGLDDVRYAPRHYVVAATDAMSRGKAEEAERGRSGGFAVHTVPRSREVGQSYVSSVFTTMRALLASVVLFARVRPHALLCNGPGTCVPLCACAIAARFLGIHRTTVIFIESFARVQSLSLTGKILYYFADVFYVQWPQLRERHPRASYRGFLI